MDKFPHAAADIIDRTFDFKGKRLAPADARYLLKLYDDAQILAIRETLTGILAVVEDEHDRRHRRRLPRRRTAAAAVMAMVLALSTTAAVAAPGRPTEPSVPTVEETVLPSAAERVTRQKIEAARRALEAFCRAYPQECAGSKK